MFWYNKGNIENRISGKFYPVPPQTMNEAKKSVPIQKLKEKKKKKKVLVLVFVKKISPYIEKKIIYFSIH